MSSQTPHTSRPADPCMGPFLVRRLAPGRRCSMSTGTPTTAARTPALLCSSSRRSCEVTLLQPGRVRCPPGPDPTGPAPRFPPRCDARTHRAGVGPDRAARHRSAAQAPHPAPPLAPRRPPLTIIHPVLLLDGEVLTFRPDPSKVRDLLQAFDTFTWRVHEPDVQDADNATPVHAALTRVSRQFSLDLAPRLVRLRTQPAQPGPMLKTPC